MSQMFQYFVIPYENVPAKPTYTVWFATWSKDRPILEPGMNSPMVLGVTTEDKLPIGAVLVASATKDPQPPPPPPPSSSFASDYEKTVSNWLLCIRDEDEEPKRP